MADKKYILNKEVAAQKLHRLALEVAEQLDGDTADLILIGVKENGFVIAQKVANIISNYTKANITVLWLSLNKLLPNNFTSLIKSERP
ncbi:MAG: hypothetical protein ACOVNY_03000, partial [Chitinophagaceae bacterium]